jgi:zinc transport system ATP-binding protein
MSTERKPAPAGAPLLACEGLVVGHGRKALLPPIDVSVAPGQFLVVIGRNGSGKSTFLKTLVGLLPPLAGRLRMAHDDVHATYVPQSAALDRVLPLQPRDLVLWGRLCKWSFLRPVATRADRAARDRALVEAEATSFASQPYRELSEGQRQRVLFARMLAAEAELVLLDEPTAAMDAIAEQEAVERLAGLCKDRGIAVVLVTHVLGLAHRHADEVLFLDRDGGHAIVGDPPTVFAHPAFRRRYGEIEPSHAR